MTAFHKLKRLVIMLPSLVALVMVSTSKAAKVLEPVMISALLPHAKHYQFTHQKIAPAIEIAIDKVKAPGGPLHGHNVTILYGNSECSSSHSMNEAINLFVNKKTHIFLGPTCAFAVAPLVRQAKFWNVPVVSPTSTEAFHKEHDEYSMLTMVGYNSVQLADSIYKLIKLFSWTKMKMLYEPNGDKTMPSLCHFVIDCIDKYLNDEYKQMPYFKFEQTSAMLADMEKEIGTDNAVIVLCASPYSVREIMIKAHELNFDNGEYVFFNIDLFTSKNSSERPWYNESDTAERNDMAKKAYEALMTVTLRKPTNEKYREFSQDVKRRAEQRNFTYGEDEVNSFVGAFHDAVILYAIALNESLADNISISNGSEITKRMWNRTFTGITGNVSIDENGDRNADYSLLDMDPNTGKFRVVANYFGNYKQYEQVAGEEIFWAGGRKEPPPDTPQCGFDGSKCPPEEPFPLYVIVIIVLGSIIILVLIISFLVYRHIKLEAELAEMNWRVKWEDILFGSPGKNKKLERQGSRMSLNRRNSYHSSCSGDTIAAHLNNENRQLFTKTGYYKGAIVAIKTIVRTNITLHKPLLLEIKGIKDLQNDHIVRFVGACIDPPNQCIITEYCPKGSLQDVLENDEIKLDWMFRYSIMQDIVRGMAYLHSSEIKSHGKLKSTNCVVDSRFVVKITDFGLHHLRKTDEDPDDETFATYQKMLWTAPELLRMAQRPHEGTQKGDVYSFGIICQEIVYRNGVFYLQNLDFTPKEIIEKVKNAIKPHFRPTMETFDCPTDELAGVIKKCWAEDPADRPDFQMLKGQIRKLNRDGDKGNILDNLLSRMEQYANNLEALVAERTADYLEEKRKAEDLLYSMLPRSVAVQLIKGESVMAETYEHVTIYFSDICGFTALSAESTAMQVVDLLNDLYTAFDTVVSRFDVYKVETIGDAYMVVSGLPVRNGNLHAREIARMSLALLKETYGIKVRHKPDYQLKLRIGIHSGSVCAGVVGLKMPRYCLFGDTVNTASRMESNGEALKIHVSPQTKDILDTFGTFNLVLRGEVEMKGKGVQTTYWLLGETPPYNATPVTSHGIL
ncbi:atrial natriuretic peptide receptor 1-like isoform X4 [Biomphalaria glabrata]|uniref:Guanylate cyclase n=1 Tax=Biomphalaria glabrata TaxID=6526 RepID=A0A9W3A8D1_BIOGL|nr:atrial natriuretic peptide receptor 1-like isoform X4 [Biomphalaria glabrata]XP_055883420.1 atrial natriuretic peptide receptor 1-like isoform X4 [Biomphalaria glabrata]XP_055883421.1 atrial natriuretic peptide receptor 1-like isoform X4 [Biomphalaria glabrata]